MFTASADRYPPNVKWARRKAAPILSQFAFPHNPLGEANLFGGAAMQAGRTIVADLNAHDCVCRVCGAPYIAHGVLCPECATAQARERAVEIGRANAMMDARIAAERVARRARRRTEWREAV